MKLPRAKFWLVPRKGKSGEEAAKGSFFKAEDLQKLWRVHYWDNCTIRWGKYAAFLKAQKTLLLRAFLIPSPPWDSWIHFSYWVFVSAGIIPRSTLREHYMETANTLS